MARPSTLLRLHKTLLSRMAALRKTLTDELGRDFEAADSVGDNADTAFESGSDEMSLRLARIIPGRTRLAFSVAAMDGVQQYNRSLHASLTRL